jgi:hypothetical protein
MSVGDLFSGRVLKIIRLTYEFGYQLNESITKQRGNL